MIRLRKTKTTVVETTVLEIRERKPAKKQRNKYKRLAAITGEMYELNINELREIKAGLPTRHLPGTYGKIEVLRIRFATGLPMFHVDDAKPNNDVIYSNIGEQFFFGV